MASSSMGRMLFLIPRCHYKFNLKLQILGMEMRFAVSFNFNNHDLIINYFMPMSFESCSFFYWQDDIFWWFVMVISCNNHTVIWLLQFYFTLKKNNLKLSISGFLSAKMRQGCKSPWWKLVFFRTFIMTHCEDPHHSETHPNKIALKLIWYLICLSISSSQGLLSDF